MRKYLVSFIPYVRRALRVFVYGAIPAVAAWVLDSNPATLEISLRVALAAGLLALLDKVRMSRSASG